MMEALGIVAGSWPIAFMVVGLAVIGTVRGFVRRSMDHSHAEQMERIRGEQTLVVQQRRERLGDNNAG